MCIYIYICNTIICTDVQYCIIHTYTHQISCLTYIRIYISIYIYIHTHSIYKRHIQCQCVKSVCSLFMGKGNLLNFIMYDFLSHDLSPRYAFNCVFMLRGLGELSCRINRLQLQWNIVSNLFLKMNFSILCLSRLYPQS